MAHELILGKNTRYVDEYAPSILCPIPRSQGRDTLSLPSFEGYDLWRLYEITYLNRQGIPQVVMGTLKVPATSGYIVESKSLKLYLGSFCQTMFDNKEQVATTIEHDLNKILKCNVQVELFEINQKAMPQQDFSSIRLEAEPDMANLQIKHYTVAPELLQYDESAPVVSEKVYTNLFRSLCPVTGQPDMASVEISYKGHKINHQNLLAYLISYRRHQGFHENCVERIFADIKNQLHVSLLTVSACFTRRGGIDISPVRSDTPDFFMPIRTPRQ